jgi:ADP-heptose:LPS heptosyltransferase
VIPLKLFADMAAIPNVRLFCLQKEEAAKERAEVDFEVIDMGGDPVARKDLFMDNAALMENLDLVISTDSAVLHMAGAVGTKTFVPIPKGSCWRWLVDRTDTPWYPSMTLFRQKEIHTWPEVFVRLTEAVKVERDLWKLSAPTV